MTAKTLGGLRCAPALPFGHFNGRWVALIDRWRAGDQLICFELATGTTPVPSDFFPDPSMRHGRVSL